MDWIDFDKQTPEDEQRCVLFIENGDYCVGKYDEEEGVFLDTDWNDAIYDVKAWAELLECNI